MTRLTPEMRRFLEAVADDAAMRIYAGTSKEQCGAAADKLYKATQALLDADTGAGEAERCPTCGKGHDESPYCSNGFHAPADRDAELERLVSGLREAMEYSMTILSTDGPRRMREAEDAIRQHVRQREEAARGEERERCAKLCDELKETAVESRKETSGKCCWGDARIQAFHEAARFVRAPEEAGHDRA